MSWIVQNLWSNRDKIRGRSDRDYGIARNFYALYGVDVDLDEEKVKYDDPFIESDEYNDLIVIEKAVKELRELGLLSQEDLDILYDTNPRHANRNKRYWLDRKFAYICQRVAYYMGGYFTDEGYINYLTRKYNLSPEQQEIARDYMRSKFKNKILTRGYRTEDNHEKIKHVSAEV